MATFNVRLPDKQDEKLKYIAEKQARSKNGQIIFIVQQFIEDYEKVNGKIDIPKD